MSTIRTETKIRNGYFRWLCKLIKDGKPDEDKTYRKLLRELDSIPYFGFVGNDQDRGDHGLQLRYLWIDSVWTKYPDLHIEDFDKAFDDRDCSFLEMLIALCTKAEDQTEGFVEEDSVGYWFWTIMENLNLGYLNDDVFDYVNGRDKVDETIDIVLNREYNFDGSGGMFPLRKTVVDQRKIEIWYQLSAYLIENVNYG